VLEGVVRRQRFRVDSAAVYIDFRLACYRRALPIPPGILSQLLLPSATSEALTPLLPLLAVLTLAPVVHGPVATE